MKIIFAHMDYIQVGERNSIQKLITNASTYHLEISIDKIMIAYQKTTDLGSLGGAAVWRLPLAQGVILETRDRIPHQVPGAWSLLLPLPMSLPLSHSLCAYHKYKIKLKKKFFRTKLILEKNHYYL